MGKLAIVRYGKDRYELQDSERRVAIVDRYEDAVLFAAAGGLQAAAKLAYQLAMRRAEPKCLLHGHASWEDLARMLKAALDEGVKA